MKRHISDNDPKRNAAFPQYSLLYFLDWTRALHRFVARIFLWTAFSGGMYAFYSFVKGDHRTWLISVIVGIAGLAIQWWFFRKFERMGLLSRTEDPSATGEIDAREL